MRDSLLNLLGGLMSVVSKAAQAWNMAESSVSKLMDMEKVPGEEGTDEPSAFGTSLTAIRWK
jgi:hypothetical protein